MPEPWEMSDEELRSFAQQFVEEGRRADEEDAYLFFKQLAEDDDGREYT